MLAVEKQPRILKVSSVNSEEIAFVLLAYLARSCTLPSKRWQGAAARSEMLGLYRNLAFVVSRNLECVGLISQPRYVVLHTELKPNWPVYAGALFQTYSRSLCRRLALTSCQIHEVNSADDRMFMLTVLKLHRLKAADKFGKYNF